MGINEESGKEKAGKLVKPTPLKKEKNIVPSSEAYALQTIEQDFPENEVRILLLGVDGSGKSSVAQLITGGEVLQTAKKSSKRISAYYPCIRNGRRYVVVDSPCLFHTRIAPKFVITEVNKLIGLTAPGPHICIFVVPGVKLSSEEKQAMSRIQNAFFPGAIDNSIIVLTKSDILNSDGTSIEDFKSNAAPVVQNIMTKCNNRVVQVDNVSGDKDTQRNQIFDMIQDVLQSNTDTFYTNDVYTLAQVNLRVHKQKAKEKYMSSDEGIPLLDKIKEVERVRPLNDTTRENETAAASQDMMETELERLKEQMLQVVCDQVRDGILQESITPFELNLRRLLTSGTKAIGKFLSFMWFVP
ncbi:GTPase IMAP family member 7-like [Antedon mediterranea]|uniref:GTPase IMAP family member 7-like n=1 Tax=Antedon mediterranea TaxID=105859 RepID=UPI003AF8C6EF